MKGIKEGLYGVEESIKKERGSHPKRIEEDDILDKLSKIFEGNIGPEYSEEEIKNIIKEGEFRYKLKIPPGFKDTDKSGDKIYGDLILWYQTIDKAKTSKKPIILVSDDVKEDWWLEKNGRKIMPLPQLKKEMLDKAGVDFHIYTADNFIKIYAENNVIPLSKDTVSEVEKIREIEQEKERFEEKKSFETDEEFVISFAGRHTMYYVYIFDILESLMEQINALSIKEGLRFRLYEIFNKSKELIKTVETGSFYESYLYFYESVKEISRLLNDELDLDNNYPELSEKFSRFRESIARLENMVRSLRRA